MADSTSGPSVIEPLPVAVGTPAPTTSGSCLPGDACGIAAAYPVHDGARLTGSGAWSHPREVDRLASLASYSILDTGRDPVYEQLVRLAARVVDAPAAAITLVDADRVWPKATIGHELPHGESPRAGSLCSDAVALGALVVVEDLLAAPRYADHELVAGPPRFRSVAAVPLVGRDGLPLGALCVLDRHPRRFGASQLEDLVALAHIVVTHLELARTDRLAGRDPSTLLVDALDPARLRKGIDEGEFVNHYQPIVDLETGQPHAFEALVRWHHPELGVLLPSLFLPAMERTGLMRALGRRVLDGALELSRALSSEGAFDQAPKVAVNVSGTELDHPGLARDVAGALARHNVAPQAICLEVTESVPLRGDVATAELAALCGLGVDLALDDYGSGNATAGMVVDLPITALKLDRSLATRVRSRRARAVVASTVHLADEIGLVLSGEGVETACQRDDLLELGVRFGQGWLFGPVVERALVLRHRRDHPRG